MMISFHRVMHKNFIFRLVSFSAKYRILRPLYVTEIYAQIQCLSQSQVRERNRFARN